MIHGIGIDLLQVERMAKAWQKFSNRLAEKILHTKELDEFNDSDRPELFLAKRWVAKEAFAKAAGTGLTAGIYMRNIQVEHTTTGQPQLSCHGASARWLQQHNAHCHLSLTDDCDMVCAVAVIVTGQ